MTLTNKGRALSQKLNAHYERMRIKGSIPFTKVYLSVEEMLYELKEVPVIRDMPAYPPYKGYEYINSFSTYLKKGWTLSEKQLNMCKKLATEIHIAYMLRNEWK